SWPAEASTFVPARQKGTISPWERYRPEANPVRFLHKFYDCRHLRCCVATGHQPLQTSSPPLALEMSCSIGLSPALSEMLCPAGSSVSESISLSPTPPSWVPVCIPSRL